MLETISSRQFDEFYNLAAQSFVGASWDTPILTSNTDAMGPLYVLDAIKRVSPHKVLSGFNARNVWIVSRLSPIRSYTLLPQGLHMEWLNYLRTL